MARRRVGTAPVHLGRSDRVERPRCSAQVADHYYDVWLSRMAQERDIALVFLYRTNLLRVLVSYLDKERDPASIDLCGNQPVRRVHGSGIATLSSKRRVDGVR